MSVLERPLRFTLPLMAALAIVPLSAQAETLGQIKARVMPKLKEFAGAKNRTAYMSHVSLEIRKIQRESNYGRTKTLLNLATLKYEKAAKARNRARMEGDVEEYRRQSQQMAAMQRVMDNYRGILDAAANKIKWLSVQRYNFVVLQREMINERKAAEAKKRAAEEARQAEARRTPKTKATPWRVLPRTQEEDPEKPKFRTFDLYRKPGRGTPGFSRDPATEYCFTAPTLVTLADGTLRRIDRIRVGDRVRGRDGAVNSVLAIHVKTLPAGDPLYGFNGREPFVTRDHPFLSARGWVSIDPRATAEWYEGALRTHKLNAGAHLRVHRATRAKMGRDRARAEPVGLPSPFTATVAVRSIGKRIQRTPVAVYWLALDGNHTYFANGWLVHNDGK